ncbi:SDR family oxidoreductase [Myceligenerans crystallogenes]|uniref:SDR family oxidoreductase n=1 Tax=Myceligenerans crystallogenes TaxID=316335 RepID=A0ABN2NLP2_9MICO
MTTLVTGASGHFGRLTIEALLARGVAPGELRAGTRRPHELASLSARGVAVVPLDYDDDASVASAVEGADQVLLVSGNELGKRVAQHAVVITAAAKAGVGHLVYTSAPRADDTSLVIVPEHAATERLLADSGLTATILRNNWYLENYAATVAQVRETGVLLTSAGDGRVASALRSELAEAAAVVLTTEEHRGRTIELGGDEAWTFAEFGAALGTVLGREVTVEQLSAEEHLARLTAAGLDEGTAGFVVAVDGNIREGALEGGTHDLSVLLGRPTATLPDALATLV